MLCYYYLKMHAVEAHIFIKMSNLIESGAPKT